MGFLVQCAAASVTFELPSDRNNENDEVETNTSLAPVCSNFTSIVQPLITPAKDLAALICAVFYLARAKCAATCDTTKTWYVKRLTSVHNRLRGSIQKN